MIVKRLDDMTALTLNAYNNLITVFNDCLLVPYARTAMKADLINAMQEVADVVANSIIKSEIEDAIRVRSFNSLHARTGTVISTIKLIDSTVTLITDNNGRYVSFLQAVEVVAVVEPVQYIYARVSTKDQNIDQQIEVLQRKCSAVTIYSEKQSGKDLDREQFNALRGVVKAGDSIRVLSVSRLGRNTLAVLEFIEEMKGRSVSVFVHDLGGLDVTSPTGKIVLTTLAAVAEMQREEILDKQRIGIERAQAEGKYKGKQVNPKTVKACKAALEYINKGLSKEAAAKAAGVGVATLYRYIKEYKQVS